MPKISYPNIWAAKKNVGDDLMRYYNKIKPHSYNTIYHPYQLKICLSYCPYIIGHNINSINIIYKTFTLEIAVLGFLDYHFFRYICFIDANAEMAQFCTYLFQQNFQLHFDSQLSRLFLFINYITWLNMQFNIFTPLSFVLTALFIDLMINKKINQAIYTLFFGPFIANIYVYLCERGFTLDNITQKEVFSFFYSSFITMISAIIIFLIYRFIKKGN